MKRFTSKDLEQFRKEIHARTLVSTSEDFSTICDLDMQEIIDYVEGSTSHSNSLTIPACLKVANYYFTNNDLDSCYNTCQTILDLEPEYTCQTILGLLGNHITML